MTESNIILTSNIYTSVDFAKHVYGFDESLQLYHKYQIDAYYDIAKKGALPYYCNDKKQWGYIKLNDEKIVYSCRCDKTDCNHYEEFMSEPYAKRINLIEKTDKEIDQSIQNKPKWKVIEGESS
jgi:hypothetical protein